MATPICHGPAASPSAVRAAATDEERAAVLDSLATLERLLAADSVS